MQVEFWTIEISLWPEHIMNCLPALRRHWNGTWVCPAISMPASKNSSKSWLNFPEAIASWPLLPREDCTTSPAEWFSSAAVWFRSVWASWKDLEHGGSWKNRSKGEMSEFRLSLSLINSMGLIHETWSEGISMQTNCKNVCNNDFSNHLHRFKFRLTSSYKELTKNSHFPQAISYWPRQCSWEPCPHPSVQVSSSHSYSGSERRPLPPEKQQHILSHQ